MPCHRIARLALLLCLAAPVASRAADAPQEPAARPNILWISCEDISANLGCYGDPDASTPRLDQLATEGVRYARAFATIGVCAPARSTIITGMYPPSIGTQHMRCRGTLPEAARCFTEYLREAGYYCTNNVKTDYNFKPPRDTWDESSKTAHWRKRRPGQPFFAVFNFTTSHESQIRLPEAQYQERTKDFTASERHDPAKAPLPPYHPDVPEARRDWARYYDMITYMDKQVGGVLAELEADGLSEETIVFYFSDHGAGMPRSKRWLYDSSTRVPFLVRFPRGLRGLAPSGPGTVSDRLISLVDVGPTVLSLTGVAVPKHMQGRAFLGAQATAPREYVHGFRDRMDERTDCLRSVRDARFKYIRNFHPERPWFHEQHLSYGYEMPTLRAWQRLSEEGKLSGPRAIFMARTKPTEELYDTAADPWEIENLAARPEHQATLERLRGELRRWQREIIDLGFLPEPDLRTRFGEEAPYDAVRLDPGLYPLERIAAAADAANRMPGAPISRITASLTDPDPAVRYWGLVGLGRPVDPHIISDFAALPFLNDPVAWVRVAAADACQRAGCGPRALSTLEAAMKDPNDWTRLAAIEVLDNMGADAKGALPVLEAALQDANPYVVRVAVHAVDQLGGRATAKALP